MVVTRDFFRLSPNRLDKFRDGLARYAEIVPHAAIMDSCGLEQSIFPTGNESFSLISGFSGPILNSALTYVDGQGIREDQRWYFGHLCYELKDKAEPGLISAGNKLTGFREELFFPAQHVFLLRGPELEVVTFNGDIPEKVLENIYNLSLEPAGNSETEVEMFSYDSYLEQFEIIRHHIRRGDIYELNYCIPVYARVKDLSIASCWRKLNRMNPAPFSALYRQDDNWLMCASPERFLKKSGDRLYSQPIKGTTARADSSLQDEINKKELLASEKERAENIMITDLVRNDLSRVAKRGSVQVDELCGLYSFRHVHQLITTVSARLKEDVSMKDILAALFPMGSMTGAPKYRAMQIIEACESFRRELFSGSVGYISPEGNFDLNVVIRSILYNAATGQLIIPAGSAITAKSDPAKEFEECRLKAAALVALIQNPVTA